MEEELRQLKEMLKGIEDRIATLEQADRDMTSNATIPFEKGEALKERILENETLIDVATTTEKATNSENINAVTSVDFVGESVNTNSVLDNPNGWLKITKKDGNTYYVPYFT